MKDKIILDVCCGSRMFWFDKNNPLVMFNDLRSEEHELCDGRHLSINPDTRHDFTNLPFEDNKFKMVVFDPPHMNRLGKKSWLALKYGTLLPTWEQDIKAGFSECMRVLDVGGFLIFKWNESQITLNDVLKLTDEKPLFGHTGGRQSKTIWLCFMKLK